jgi:hypothetical protein
MTARRALPFRSPFDWSEAIVVSAQAPVSAVEVTG